MKFAVVFFTFVMLMEMIYRAIDDALSPYEPAFYQYGGLVVMAVLLALALRERRSRGTGSVQQGLSACSARLFPAQSGAALLPSPESATASCEVRFLERLDR